MYLFTSLVVLTIFPPEDWLRSANLSGLSDVFWSTGMTNSVLDTTRCHFLVVMPE